MQDLKIEIAALSKRLCQKCSLLSMLTKSRMGGTHPFRPHPCTTPNGCFYIIKQCLRSDFLPPLYQKQSFPSSRFMVYVIVEEVGCNTTVGPQFKSCSWWGLIILILLETFLVFQVFFFSKITFNAKNCHLSNSFWLF